MQLQWNKKPCQFLQAQVQQLQFVEQTLEVRLSEELPDIGRVVSAWGQPVIRSKEWRNDGMNVSGGVNASVLYMPEDGTSPQCVEAWIPVQVKWNFPNTQHEGNIRVQCSLRGIEARTISARKMVLRVDLWVYGEALNESEVMITSPDEVPEGVELLQNIYPVVLPKEMGEKEFVLEEELRVSNAGKWISRILIPEITEKTVVGNRFVIRGNVILHYVYLDEQGALHSADHQIPFAQFADLEQEYDKEATVDVMFCFSALDAEASEEGIRVQCTLMAQYVVWNRMLLEVVEDAYSCRNHLTAIDELIQLPVELDNRTQIKDITCYVPGKRILDMVFMPDYPVAFEQNDMTYVNMSGVFQYLYVDEEENIQSGTEKWSEDMSFSVGEGAQLRVTVEPYEVRGMNVKVSINLQTRAKQNLNIISAISVGESKKHDPLVPNLILRRMGTTTLWELAKATGSTMSAIRDANHLTEDPEEGRILLIPVI